MKDILQRVLQASAQSETFTEAMAIEIEQSVRADWGGEKAYIPKKAPIEQRRAEVKRVVGELGVARATAEVGMSREGIYKLIGKRWRR